ncbi:hypothetical protein HPG69_003991 [Diceros bicornis minor]|uniref:Uncharacterized protein n=1 Tax=Diceros bicornis minor TaxID=77932 RepID=A0A7J7F1J7_DICBM|nr:hypothetical protein HPG69_003991 [Diceros bicornis minor]
MDPLAATRDRFSSPHSKSLARPGPTDASAPETELSARPSHSAQGQGPPKDWGLPGPSGGRGAGGGKKEAGQGGQKEWWRRSQGEQGGDGQIHSGSGSGGGDERSGPELQGSLEHDDQSRGLGPAGGGAGRWPG